jgi:membrane-bound inhibitor of C-type lysozyme
MNVGVPAIPPVAAREASSATMTRRFAGLAVVTLALALSATVALAADLTIHLPGNGTVSRRSVQYACDSAGSAIGVPSGPFTVEYINGGGNSLVIVPIAGNLLIFSNVIAGSGARYTARQYSWWEGRGGVTLGSDSLAGKANSTCHRVND